MNYVAESNQPVNSLMAPAAPGQVITIWGMVICAVAAHC
jgi:hypothetical protein